MDAHGQGEVLAGQGVESSRRGFLPAVGFEGTQQSGEHLLYEFCVAGASPYPATAELFSERQA